jgi:hypothetical protein
MSSDDSIEAFDDDVVADDLSAYNLAACNSPAKVVPANGPAMSRQRRS